jgi:methylated-DNA-[protein]-cysteine S-methyltransferase
MKELLIDRIDSAIGEIMVVSDGESLCALDFADYEPRMIGLLNKRYKSLSLTKKSNPQGFSSRLQAYFKGDYHILNEIPVKTGGTPFQQQVWLALRTIAPGTVMFYGELAAKLARSKACRAVGMANSLNPVGIVLPCHRVVGANFSLTGYAGGLDRKQWLLAHEGVDLTNLSQKAKSCQVAQIALF